MKQFSRKAFTLIESLSMMVTLVVFGWLSVAVIRYHFRPELHPNDKPIFATQERVRGDSKEPQKPATPKGTETDDKPWQKMLPPAPVPTPAKP